jgi:CheY-like chemotaxis protein
MTSVLIVEDDPEQARALSRMFARLRPDLTILTAENGVVAKRLIRERGVDLILTDLQMPEMDGFELLAWANEHCPHVAVFTMSAYGNGHTAAQLGGLGASDYFPKPLDEQAVVESLAETLNQAVHGEVHNVSLASFLQLLEMERKSCTLSVQCGEKRGALSIRKGALVAATCGELSGEAAAIAVIAWPAPSITITRGVDMGQSTIQSSLGFILMEAMRIQDEEARKASAEGRGSVWPSPLRTWRPSGAPGEPLGSASSRPPPAEQSLPSGTKALALVETATGNVLRASARDDCPVGELARLAAQLLLQEAETLRLCSEAEGVEELVLSTSSRCDVIRPIGQSEFALLVFVPSETNLVIARMELDQFVAQHRGAGH